MTGYIGRHRTPAPSWNPDRANPAPTVRAGFGLSLGNTPHMTLEDETGAQVRIDLAPEDVEHIVEQARNHMERMEARYRGDFDPTDAELAVAWNAPDAHEAHKAAWRIHQETRA